MIKSKYIFYAAFALVGLGLLLDVLLFVLTKDTISFLQLAKIKPVQVRGRQSQGPMRYEDLRDIKKLSANSGEFFSTLVKIPDPITQSEVVLKKKVSRYKLTLIWAQNPPTAIIDSEIVQEGSKLQDNSKVIKIRETSVVIKRDDGEEIVVKMEED